jgi:hypothetical protein
VTGGTMLAVARGGELAPGVTGRFYRFGRPALNGSGAKGYWASLVSPVSASVEPSAREGVWVERSGVVEELAVEGRAAPEAGGAVFDSFYDPAINAEGIAAFLGYLAEGSGGVDEGNRKGIWVGGLAESLRLVCRSDDTPPGMPGAKFKSFSSPRLNRIGQVAFTATLVSGEGGVTPRSDYGCWATTPDGALTPVLREGDVIGVGPGDARTVKSLRLASLSDGGALLFEVCFGDDSCGLIRARVPVPSVLDYGQWAADHIPDAALRGRGQDADGDGLINFFEFAFGLDPMNGALGAAPSVALVSVPSGDGAMDLLSIRFQRRLDGSGVEYRAQVSDDLVNWTDTDEVVDVVLVGGGMQEVTIRDTVAAAGERRRFIRVVTVEP